MNAQTGRLRRSGAARINRRDFLKMGGVGLAGASLLGVVGCGGGTSGGSGGDSRSAVFVTFGSQEDVAIKKAWLEPVAKKRGIDVRLDSPTDYVKLQTQVETDNVSWTIVMADPWWAKQNCGDLIEKRPADVDVSAIDPAYLIDDCAVPGDTFTFTCLYDETKFRSPPPRGWKEFFDTGRFPGKRGVWGGYAVNGTLEGALLADGVNAETLYPLDLDRAFGKLDTIKNDISFFDTIAQGEQQAAAGDVSMMVTVNASGYHLATQGKRWLPIWDGALESYDAYVIPKGANVDAAVPFLNRIASPEGQSDVISSGFPVGPTVKNLRPKPKVDKRFATYLPGDGTILLDQDYYAENFDEVNSRWTTWVSG